MAHFSGAISSLLQLAFLLLRLVIEAVPFLRLCLCSYAFAEVDIIVLEGIFLLKRTHRYYLEPGSLGGVYL